jgi:hypothetical protein
MHKAYQAFNHSKANELVLSLAGYQGHYVCLWQWAINTILCESLMKALSVAADAFAVGQAALFDDNHRKKTSTDEHTRLVLNF